MINYIFLLLFGIHALPLATCFTSTHRSVPKSRTPLNINAFYNDFEGFGDDQPTSDVDLYASLRDRQSLLDQAKRDDLQAWRNINTQMTAIPLSGDWIRRVAIDASQKHEIHTVVAGGASGSLYLVDLETGATLGDLEEVHTDQSKENAELIDLMYGEYDGGGVMALARKDKLIASAGREGGFLLSTIMDDDNTLQPLGQIDWLTCSVTSLLFDENDVLWVGSYEDKTIRGYNMEDLLTTLTDDPVEDETELHIPQVCEIQAESGILSLAIREDIGCGVAATAKDGIVLFSTRDPGTVLATWNPFEDDQKKKGWKNPFDMNNNKADSSSAEYARSVAIVQNDEAPSTDKPASWSVVIGGSKGSFHQQQLKIDPDNNSVNPKSPWNTVVGPPHQVPERYCHRGMVVSLVSPGPGLLLSGAQDGTLRAWDCSYLQPSKECAVTKKFEPDLWIGGFFGSGSKPRPIFGMAGYKVWLGSLVVLPGNRLITDGADNCIVAHYFQKKQEEEEE